MLKRIFTVLVLLVLGSLLAVYAYLHSKNGAATITANFEQVKGWPQLPANFVLGNPTGLDMDTSGNLWVFHRGSRRWPASGIMPKEPITESTLLVLSSSTGELIRSWGAGLFVMPHGLKIDQQNNIWLTDVGLHQVFKFSNAGVLLMTLGEAGVPGTDAAHFDKPTDVAIAKDGSFFVSDGYGNSRVLHFTPDGKLIRSWGTKGDKPGQFVIPHGISLNYKGQVLVADRENNRIQVFDTTGRYIRTYTDRSFGVITCVRAVGNDILTADDLSFYGIGHQGSDLIRLDSSGFQRARVGRSGGYSGENTWYHALTVDSQGNVYLGDILSNTIQKFKPLSFQP